MEREWNKGLDLMQALDSFSVKLRFWNKDTFGCIFERKKRVRRRLEGVMRAVDMRPTLRPLKLEKNIKQEWSETLL